MGQTQGRIPCGFAQHKFWYPDQGVASALRMVPQGSFRGTRTLRRRRTAKHLPAPSFPGSGESPFGTPRKFGMDAPHQLFRGLPVDASIGNGDAVAELFLGHWEGLVPSFKVAFDHRPLDG